MPYIDKSQFKTIELAPSNMPKAVYKALGDIVLTSADCKCKIESVDPTTGEYRIVLIGTLVNRLNNHRLHSPNNPNKQNNHSNHNNHNHPAKPKN